MKARISPLVFLLSALTIVAGLHAQEQATFRDSVEVRVINVDVFVEDADGKRVTGLTADDFEILENGKSQPITNFAEYRTGQFVEKPQPVAPDAPIPSVREVEPRQPRTVIFVVDTFHQTPDAREKLFLRIRTFLRESLDSGDRAALFNWRTSLTSVIPLTTDLSKIDDALTRIAGLQLPTPDSGVDQLQQFFEEAEAFRQSLDGREVTTGGPSSLAAQMETTIRNCAEEYLSEMETKTIALESMINSLGGIDGRKALVYVAGRFPADTAAFCQSIMRTPTMGPAALTFRAGSFSTDRLVDRVTAAANAAGVTFYPIRPTTIERRTTAVEYVDESNIGASSELGQTLVRLNDADALATLAEDTGGRLAVGDWMIDDVITEIVSDLDNYYSLGYRASSDGRDRERKITVRTRDRSLKARTREAFVEKSRLTQVKDQLVANLVATPLRGDIDLEVIVGEAKPQRRGRSILPIEIRIPLDQLLYQGQKPTSEVRLLSAAGSTPGNITEVSDTRKKIEQPPADLPSPFITWTVDLSVADEGTKVSFAVFDEISGLAGYATVDRTPETLERLAREELESLDRWQTELIRRHRGGKPILVYFRPERCFRRSGFRTIPICEDFEQDVLAHPEIARRLEELELVRWAPDGKTADWPAGKPGLALVRVDGYPILRWRALPDGVNLARTLDSVLTHKAELVRINALTREGHLEHADLSTAMMQIRFGLRQDAETILDRLASGSSQPAVAEIAAVRLAFLDAGQSRARGLARLNALATGATENVARSEAWLAIAALSEGDEKLSALQGALETSPAGSQQRGIAQNELERLSARIESGAAIRIATPGIASGRTELRTIVQSAAVDSVEFVLDGKTIERDGKAPFRATTDLERLPTRHELHVIARDPNGGVIGEDRTVLNGSSDAFWVRITAPESDVAIGETVVELALQVPRERRVASVIVQAGENVVAVNGPPWSATVTIPAGEATALETRAVLDDGSIAGDTKILNLAGMAEMAGVHLVELPLIPVDARDLTASEITVSEGGERRTIDSLLGAEDVPLTLGLAIDTSPSMFERMLDVQTAAGTFVEQALQPNDRGFLVSFDSEARLDVGVTGDKQRLLTGIRSLSPAGSTALFDGIMLGLLQFEPLGGRRALVVFSDGDDRTSRYKLEDVAEVAKRAGVPIYLVRAEPESDSGRPANTTRMPGSPGYLQRTRLGKLTAETGGGFYELASLEELDEIFGEIASVVSSQMILTYQTETSRDEEWRTVEVRLEGKGEVKAPQGYYARPY